MPRAVAPLSRMLFTIFFQFSFLEVIELYQSNIIYAFFCCGCAATAVVHATLPHKKTTLRLCRKRKMEKMYLYTIQFLFYSIFVNFIKFFELSKFFGEKDDIIKSPDKLIDVIVRFVSIICASATAPSSPILFTMTSSVSPIIFYHFS
jgi:hypothetical protein